MQSKQSQQMTQQTQQQQQKEHAKARKRRQTQQTQTQQTPRSISTNTPQEKMCHRVLKNELSASRLGRRYGMDDNVKHDLLTQGLEAFRSALRNASQLDERGGASTSTCRCVTQAQVAVKRLVEARCAKLPRSSRHGQEASASRSADKNYEAAAENDYEAQRKASIEQNNQKLIELGLMPPS